MKKQRVFMAAMLGCVLTAPAWAAPAELAEKTSAEFKAVLRQHHDAMNKQDIKALMALYADNPNVALMGTGTGEFWKGKAAVENTYQEFFKTYKAGSLTYECPDTSGGEDGNDGWLMASCVMKDIGAAGQPREFGLNVSAVLKKGKDGWRVQALHTSNLIEDDGPPPEAAAPAPEATPKKVP
jgi:ketosteroid isomerase-like protein